MTPFPTPNADLGELVAAEKHLKEFRDWCASPERDYGLYPEHVAAIDTVLSAIAAQQREIERLQQELNEAAGAHDYAMQAEARAEALEKERDALKLERDRLLASFRDLNTKINGFIYEVLECPPPMP